jgi:hypothetical protein
MNGPPGYPPPTLVRRRRGLARPRHLVLLAVVAVVLGTCTLGRLIGTSEQPAVQAPPAQDRPAVRAETQAGIRIVRPVEDSPRAQPSPDARKPNRWYYVARLGNGPEAIYSLTGLQWIYVLS